MFKPRTLYWFLKSFFKKKSRYVFLGFVLGFLLSLYWYTGYFISLRNIFVPENTIGMVGEYNYTNLPFQIQNKISLGLTQITADDRATPSAALSWEVKDGGKTFIFNLDTKRKWHDGSKFRSFDINYRLKDVEILALGENKVAFKFKQPFSSLPHIVSQPLFKNGLVGLGEYKAKRIAQKDGFFEKMELENIKNHDDRVVYKFYTTEKQAKIALKLKKIARIEGVSDQNIFKSPDNLISTSVNFHEIVTLFFNTKKDALGEKTIRNGLSYAVPNSIKNDYTRALGPISKSSWYYNGNLKEYDENIELAQKYLKDLISGKDATMSAQSKIEISTFPSYKQVAEKIAAAWNSLGLKATVKIVQDSSDENYDVFLAAVRILPDPDQYYLWHSTQENNISHLKSPRIDKILEDGRKETTEEGRQKKYQEFQKFLVEENPALFLFYTNSYTISRI